MKRDKRTPAHTDRDELERPLEGLRRDIRHLQPEHDPLNKANELVKKDPGVDLPLLSNRGKTTPVDALRYEYSLAAPHARLDLARSAYLCHRSPTNMQKSVVPLPRSLRSITDPTAIAGRGQRSADNVPSDAPTCALPECGGMAKPL
jgi:hypothetical protein